MAHTCTDSRGRSIAEPRIPNHPDEDDDGVVLCERCQKREVHDEGEVCPECLADWAEQFAGDDPYADDEMNQSRLDGVA